MEEETEIITKETGVWFSERIEKASDLITEQNMIKITRNIIDINASLLNRINNKKEQIEYLLDQRKRVKALEFASKYFTKLGKYFLNTGPDRISVGDPSFIIMFKPDVTIEEITNFQERVGICRNKMFGFVKEIYERAYPRNNKTIQVLKEDIETSFVKNFNGVDGFIDFTKEFDWVNYSALKYRKDSTLENQILGELDYKIKTASQEERRKLYLKAFGDLI